MGHEPHQPITHGADVEKGGRRQRRHLLRGECALVRFRPFGMLPRIIPHLYAQDGPAAPILARGLELTEKHRTFRTRQRVLDPAYLKTESLKRSIDGMHRLP